VLNWLPWLVAVTAAVWMARSRAPHRLAITATLAMLAYSSVRVMRVESLFVEAAAILIAPLVIQQWPMPLIQLPPRSTLEPVVAAIIFGLLLIPTGWVASWSLTCVPILGTWPPDAAPARALTAARAGRLVTHFNWGEYAIWHFGPRLRVSMDGRRETVYSDARLAEYDAVLAGSPAGLETLARWRADYVWLPVTSDLTRRWLATHGYREDFASTRSFVAVRADLPVLPVPPAVEGGRRCFPE
jgi:hypothetical protein